MAFMSRHERTELQCIEIIRAELNSSELEDHQCNQSQDHSKSNFEASSIGQETLVKIMFPGACTSMRNRVWRSYCAQGPPGDVVDLRFASA